jgi:hypothetical protein
MAAGAKPTAVGARDQLKSYGSIISEPLIYIKAAPFSSNALN